MPPSNLWSALLESKEEVKTLRGQLDEKAEKESHLEEKIEELRERNKELEAVVVSLVLKSESSDLLHPILSTRLNKVRGNVAKAAIGYIQEGEGLVQELQMGTHEMRFERIKRIVERNSQKEE